MITSDELKKSRNSAYRSEGNDPDEPSNTSRIIQLSEEEKKSLEIYEMKPGEEMILEVRGNLEGDHFHVMSVSYAGGKKSPSQAMSPGTGMGPGNMGTLGRPQLSTSPS